MKYTNEKVEGGRSRVRAAQDRVARERVKLAQAEARRDPVDELRARLMIMEQSLIAMTRFLRILERDLEEEANTGPNHRQKRIKRPKAGKRG